MTVRPDVDKELRKLAGGTGFSVSGTTATITGNLTHNQLVEAMEKARLANHDFVVTAGVITVVQR